jgi:hypothetical protein
VETGNLQARLRERSVIQLKDCFARDVLTRLKQAAVACFEAVETNREEGVRHESARQVTAGSMRAIRL